MRVPEQAYVTGMRSLQYILERCRGSEVVMRLDYDCHPTRPRIVAQFVQARGHSRLRLLVRESAGIDLVLPAKDANIGCAKTCGQIDEPPRISQFFCPFVFVREIQIR